MPLENHTKQGKEKKLKVDGKRKKNVKPTKKSGKRKRIQKMIT